MNKNSDTLTLLKDSSLKNIQRTLLTIQMLDDTGSNTNEAFILCLIDAIENQSKEVQLERVQLIKEQLDGMGNKDYELAARVWKDINYFRTLARTKMPKSYAKDFKEIGHGKKPKKKLNQTSGYTLIEVMFAVAIIFIFTVWIAFGSIAWHFITKFW